VLRRHDELRVFDVKYKAHFAQLDKAGCENNGAASYEEGSEAALLRYLACI
jgi:hypothetical protein